MYVKVFTQILDSSIAEDYLVRLVFEDLLKLADKDGSVDMTAGAIARRTNVPLNVVTSGIEKLEEPDPTSRSLEEEGRRIVRIDSHRPWGWRIVNYAHYRGIRDGEDRKAYFRESKAAQRARSKNVQDNHGQSSDVTHAEAEAEAEAEGRKASPVAAGATPALDPEGLPLSLLLNDGSEYVVPAADGVRWASVYPAVDVKLQLLRMREWCINNPRERKTRRGIGSFITRWLGREQDKPKGASNGTNRNESGAAARTERHVNLWDTEAAERKSVRSLECDVPSNGSLLPASGTGPRDGSRLPL